MPRAIGLDMNASGGITVEAHNARLLKQIFKNLEKGSA